MKKDQVGQMYQQVNEKLEALKDENKQFVYATLTKYLPKHGYIHGMTMDQLVQAKKWIDKQVANNLTSEMESLGIKPSEISQKETKRILGINIDVWIKDMQTRVEELRHEAKINNLENDRAILHKHLDENALFDMDMMKLSSETAVDTAE